MKNIGLFSLFVIQMSCDPSHEVDYFIQNNSSHELIAYYQDFNANTVIIPPNTLVNLGPSKATGYPYQFNCCPCYMMRALAPTDTSVHLNKAIMEDDNWGYANQNTKAKEFEAVTCVFTVEESDVD